KEEAERIRQLAKQEAAELVRRDSVTAASEQRARNIMERAQREADILRHDADAYVLEVLGKLEEDLVHSLNVVRNGLRKVHVEREATAAALSAQNQVNNN